MPVCVGLPRRDASCAEAIAAIDIRKCQIKTRTLAKAIDIEIPDFLSHPGCRHNMSYDAMRDEVLANGEGKVVENDTMLVDTGKFTGRCPKDRYIVDDGEAHNNVGWGAINLPIKKSTFDKIFDMHCKRLQSLEQVYVFEGFVGASKKSRRSVRVVTELAWHHHFCTNMFLRPTEKELENFTPDLTIVNSRAKFEQWQEEGLRSETCVALDVNRGLQVVTGTEYSGEMKKGAFSMMNYLLPLEGIMSMHCSATVGPAGDTAIFFGLSGTGKTTLSADTTRYLIGDDEHGWDDQGVFNLEGGCYAKMVDLNPEKEPLIHAAICRDAILENVIVDADGKCDYKDISKTENTRGSYPMWHIPNHLPEGFAGHPKNVIFLACDAFGVLPPVSKLTREQALFYLVNGYTAKVAGTEMGVTEPTPTFSICFGGAFMPLPAKKYAQLFEEKIKKHEVNVFLVNTGWTGGAYGVGKRMDINATRAIVAAILEGRIEEDNLQAPDAFFQLRAPKQLPGVETSVLSPREAWADKAAFDIQAARLRDMFLANWTKFSADPFMERLGNYGPGGNALLQ